MRLCRKDSISTDFHLTFRQRNGPGNAEVGGGGVEIPTQVPRGCSASTNLAAHRVEGSHFLELRRCQNESATLEMRLCSACRSSDGCCCARSHVQNASSLLIYRHRQTKRAFTSRGRGPALAPRFRFLSTRVAGSCRATIPCKSALISSGSQELRLPQHQHGSADHTDHVYHHG